MSTVSILTWTLTQHQRMSSFVENFVWHTWPLEYLDFPNIFILNTKKQEKLSSAVPSLPARLLFTKTCHGDNVTAFPLVYNKFCSVFLWKKPTACVPWSAPSHGAEHPIIPFNLSPHPSLTLSPVTTLYTNPLTSHLICCPLQLAPAPYPVTSPSSAPLLPYFILSSATPHIPL